MRHLGIFQAQGGEGRQLFPRMLPSTVVLHLGMVMDHDSIGLFIIQVDPYIFLAQNYIKLELGP